jgi:hypothetical protein
MQRRLKLLADARDREVGLTSSNSSPNASFPIRPTDRTADRGAKNAADNAPNRPSDRTASRNPTHRDRPHGATRRTPGETPNPFAGPSPTYSRAAKPPRRVLGVSSEVAELFATEVESAIETGLLRFTERRRLIARAQRLGMSRFDANLVIASVLNAQPTTLNASPITPRWHLSPTITLFLLAEAAIIGGAVWLLCH